MKRVVQVNNLLSKLRYDEELNQIKTLVQFDRNISDYYKNSLLAAMQNTFKDSSGAIYYKLSERNKNLVVMFIVNLVESTRGDLNLIVYPYCNAKFGNSNFAYSLYMALYSTIFRCYGNNCVVPVTFVWYRKSKFQRKLLSHFKLFFEEPSGVDNNVFLSTYYALYWVSPGSVNIEETCESFNKLVALGQEALKNLRDSIGTWAYQVNGNFVKYSLL